MKIDPHYPQQRYSPMTSFLKYKFYVDIHGVPWRGASNDSGVIENVVVAFPLTDKFLTLNDSEWPLYVKFCFVPVCL